MPRAYRTRVSRPPLSEAARRWLLYGEATKHDAPGFEDYCAARHVRPLELWREHGADLMGEFIEEHPGQRPYAWWFHDCPPSAWRLKLGGSGEASAVVEAERIRGYCDCDPADPPRVESVAAFLRRLGLLLPGEEARVPKRAWRPVRFKVDGEGWAPPLGDDDDGGEA